MDRVWQAEDSLREKKVESDLKGLLKTFVAFVNSVAPGDTAKIFIGEKDDGTGQGVRNAESIGRHVLNRPKDLGEQTGTPASPCRRLLRLPTHARLVPPENGRVRLGLSDRERTRR